MLVDSHLHLDELTRPIEAAHAAVKAQVRLWLTVAVNAASFHRQQQLRAELKHAEPALTIWPAFGLHPERFDHRPEDREQLAMAVADSKDPLAAVGEIGLPSYRRTTPEEWAYQKDLARFQLDLASRYQRPVIVHAVHRAVRPMLELLTGRDLPGVVFHWLKASPEEVKEIVARGYYVGFTPDLVWRTRDQRLFSAVPPGQVLVETDAPWAHDRQKAIPSAPEQIAFLIKFLDRWRPLSEQSWGERTRANFLGFLGRTGA